MTTDIEELSASAPDGTDNRRSGLLRARAMTRLPRIGFEGMGLAIALVALCIVFQTQTPYFLTSGNLSALGQEVALIGILAAAQTVVLVSGSLDLSFTAILALSGLAAQKVFLATNSFPLTIAAGIGTGLACGLVNASVVVGAGVNPLIATIGTQFAYTGIAYLWLGNTNLPYIAVHSAWSYIGNGFVAGVPFAVVLCAAAIAAVWFWMTFTRFGARVYAVGGSASAGRLAGVSVPRLRTTVFAISGISAAVGGLLLTSQTGTAFANAAQEDLLVVLAAVILGGTALSGGRGTVLGTTLGVLFLGGLANGLNLVGANSYWQVFISGVVLVAAVVIDERRKRREER